MRAVCVSFLLCIGLVAILPGQLATNVTAGLRSAHWNERYAAYRALAAKENRSRAEDTALVALLAQEPELIGREIGSENPGEGYAEYEGQLQDTVAKIAEKDPERADVWPLLATCYNDGDTAFGRWIATHADKTVGLIEPCAKSTNTFFRANGLTSLAQIVAYERQPGTARHLDSKKVQVLEAEVRAGLGDSDAAVRMEAATALAIMGTQDDIAVLQNIAATDPYFDPQIAAQGPQYSPYSVRVNAGYAIKRLETKLKVQQ
jgi:hypothetical protein